MQTEATFDRAHGSRPAWMTGAVLVLLSAPLHSAEGDVKRGTAAFRACAACHSTETGRHLTGPSLAEVYGRKAGSASGFLRYSDALRKSGVTWNEHALDAWLANPARFIPHNEMTFAGVKDPQARSDLIAYLKAVSQEKEVPRGGGPRMPRLKAAKPDSLVKTVRYCKDTYFITTEAGETARIWEFNLRLKTDSSEYGPAAGRPVLLGAGMQGDRASLIFSQPEEISTTIKSGCE